MQKNKPAIRTFAKTFLFLAAIAVTFSGCKKSIDAPASGSSLQEKSEHTGSDENGKKIGHFNEVNLISSSAEYNPLRLDPTLINAWGIAFAPSGIPWVSSQGGHVSEVYDREGIPLAISPVHIPLPGLTEGGNPTGVVFNPTTQFTLPTGGPARFIFVGVDGVLSAWNGAQGNHALQKAFDPLGAFTGLATGTNGTMNMLYAANFRARKINAWDGNWNAVSLPFMDPNLPAGYSPYNIQNIGGWLYVTYAKVATNGRAEPGVGKGFVDIYTTAGTLVKRFASGGTLNAPWGLTMAPASFLDHDQDEMEEGDNHGPSHQFFLVGNFGDGRINAYRDDGKFMGQLRGNHKELVIEGLWALVFPPSTSTIDPNRLYFSSGPDEETQGVFGYVVPGEHDDD
jgi:uncharacterized protein (TIGR03118 family)